MKLIRSQIDLNSRVLIMGVLNITPDSFSDGGRFNDIDRAIERAVEIETEGADILDIGGESTRPGSTQISADEEKRRVIPVIEKLLGRVGIPISIDTTKADVAREAVESGAEIINDISGLRFDEGLASVAALSGAGFVLMHSRGTPQNMQQLPPVDDIFVEVENVLGRSIDLALKNGVLRDKIIIDPGIGFGKTPEQNLQLIAGLDRIRGHFDLPVLLGPSRKSFIKRTLDRVMETGIRNETRESLAGTAAAIAFGVLRGARIIRVHDIAEMVVMVRMTEALTQALEDIENAKHVK